MALFLPQRRASARNLATAIFALLFCASSAVAQGLEPSTERPQTSDQVQVYLEAIEQALAENGPYNVELVDLYYGYGQALRDEGDLEAASDAFHRTVLVTRVNSGPNSLEQSSYLRSVAEIEYAQGNHEEALSVVEHIYRLNAIHYGEGNPEMLPAVKELYDWYREQKFLRSPPLGASDFENRAFFAQRIAILTQNAEGLGSPQTAAAFRKLGQVHFHAILHLLRTAEVPQPELVVNADESPHLLTQRFMGAHFQIGEEAFQRTVDSRRANPDSSSLEIAEAMAQLGDWYIALQHFRAAEKQYERAYKFLAQSEGDTSLADEYLGRPAPLRFLHTSGSLVRDAPAGAADAGLEVSMTVTRSGRLMDILYLKTPPGESEEELNGFRQRLEHTRIRPAVIEGEVEKIEEFVWKPVVPGTSVVARDG
jgi:tetratricopeptide (TPR) repeat protein